MRQQSPNRMLRSGLDNPEFIFEKSWRNSRDTHIENDFIVYLSRFTLPVSRWTTVPLDNKLLNHILQLFWTWDCTVNRVIDRVMFEEDLKLLDPSLQRSSNLCFCSPFLVNSILAYGCMYTTNEETFLELGNHLTRGAAFAKEAARLLPLEYETPSLPLVQGLAALVVYEACLGNLSTTLDYMNRFYESYRKLDMDLCNGKWQTDILGPRRDKISQALSYIHWGFYIYEWKQQYALGRPKSIRKPKSPKLWLDEHASLLSREETADHWWFAYPLSLTPRKSLKREIFAAECEFTEILEEVLDFLSPVDGFPAPNEDPQKASKLYGKLVDWKFSLPDELREENAVHPAAILLHANLDCVLISLLQPFDTLTQQEFGSINPMETSYSHAQSMMSTIWTFRALYTVRHEFYNTQLFSVAAFRTLFDFESSSIRLQTFLRACQALSELSERFTVARDVMASLQSVVVQRKLHIPSFLKTHLNVEVGGAGSSIMQFTVVPAALRTTSKIQKEPNQPYRLTISDLVAMPNSGIEPD
ncbi:hypothetical protein VTI28DRAFT_4449 [Corynascus sepedonium]